MRLGNGKMRYGQNCTPSDELNCYSKGSVRAPWILERRNGLAQGIYNRSQKDDRFPGRQILAEVQWCLNTVISGGGFSAYQMVFGSNPADLYGWEDKDEDLMFAQDTSLSGQFAQQGKLRMMAQVAALKEIDNRGLRQLTAFNKFFTCADE